MPIQNNKVLYVLVIIVDVFIKAGKGETNFN